jgi:hypothetical protein
MADLAAVGWFGIFVHFSTLFIAGGGIWVPFVFGHSSREAAHSCAVLLGRFVEQKGVACFVPRSMSSSTLLLRYALPLIS